VMGFVGVRPCGRDCMIKGLHVVFSFGESFRYHRPVLYLFNDSPRLFRSTIARRGIIIFINGESISFRRVLHLISPSSPQEHIFAQPRFLSLGLPHLQTLVLQSVSPARISPLPPYKMWLFVDRVPKLLSWEGDRGVVHLSEEWVSFDLARHGRALVMRDRDQCL